MTTPHREKLLKALKNPKCPAADKKLLERALVLYEEWVENMKNLSTKGQRRIVEMTELFNSYKYSLEVELILSKGTPFIKRQRGQLKIGGSAIEEFFVHLFMSPIWESKEVEDLIGSSAFNVGHGRSFMSFYFNPPSLNEFQKRPFVRVKLKDQDFLFGKEIFYKFATSKDFPTEQVEEGSIMVPVVALECKINFDKTMFQEAAATAEKLKEGFPVAKYYVVTEFLDMRPENLKITKVDNVFILRKAKRLSSDKRDKVSEVAEYYKNFPISSKVIYKLVKEIEYFFSSEWFSEEKVLTRGSFI
ncbi:hypothetical protein DRN74_05465 [Candidatus Micrarchaeota archaeon]|nr:MAG: hypothetical protein DRN74_05465 [Candidatus Micrarchaeota archaeon]